MVLYALIKRKDNHIVALRSLILIFSFVFSTAQAQTGNTVEYVSTDDRTLSINSIAVAKVVDNVNNVYSDTLTDWLVKKIEQDNQWNASVYSRMSDTDYFSPSDAQKVLRELKTDALLTSRVLRGPQGLSLRMTLYVGTDGLPLVQESRVVPKSDSLEDVKREFSNIFDVIHNRLPYDGVVLSRKGNDVTINIGKNYNVRAGQQIDVIQILKIQRHPKHQFMISSEKSIIGKIIVTKSDDSLSFGRISFEKESGVVRPGNKIISQRMIKYPTQEELLRDPSFGDNPSEWVDQSAPQFGRLQVWAGIGQYQRNENFVTSGSKSASSSISPTLQLDGQLWLNTEWFLEASIMQSAFTLSNPIDGDSPSNLNTTLSSYSIAGGYTWLLSQDYFGPKLQVSAGLHQWIADPARSTQVAFTRNQFGGMYIGFDGSFNLVQGSPWDLGAKFKFFLTDSLAESPKSGDSSDISVLDFALYTSYRKSSRMSYLGQINFQNYSSNFSGTATRPEAANKITHKNTLILLGIEYAF